MFKKIKNWTFFFYLWTVKLENQHTFICIHASISLKGLCVLMKLSSDIIKMLEMYQNKAALVWHVSLYRSRRIQSRVIYMLICSAALYWCLSLCFSSCLGVIKKSLFHLSLWANSTGIVGLLKHPHTNVGWHTINAPDFHWLNRPWLVFSLQQYYADALSSNPPQSS